MPPPTPHARPLRGAQCSDYLGVMDKLKGAYGIRDNFKRATELDPTDAESVHCLGQWCYSIAEMGASSWVARNGMASIGLKASFEEALGHFEAAERLKSPYLVNDLMAGKCHFALRQWASAVVYLGKVVDAGEQVNPDDQDARQAALRLLAAPQLASNDEGVSARSGTAPLLATAEPRH